MMGMYVHMCTEASGSGAKGGKLHTGSDAGLQKRPSSPAGEFIKVSEATRRYASLVQIEANERHGYLPQRLREAGPHGRRQRVAGVPTLPCLSIS